MGSWLPLTDYSIKYKVSVSTLRRRIKTEDLKFRFDDGKYFIIDEPMSTHQREHRPSQDEDSTLMGAPLVLSHMPLKTKEKKSNREQDLEQDQDFSQTKMKSVNKNITTQVYKEVGREEPILAAANTLLNELKKAYTQILQEKEQQIFQLREEVADLKTLVRVLEGENDRLSAL